MPSSRDGGIGCCDGSVVSSGDSNGDGRCVGRGAVKQLLFVTSAGCLISNDALR